MKIKKYNLIFPLLAIFIFFLASFFCQITPTISKAKSTVFEMSGASVRFMQTNETADNSTSGIRFSSRILQEDYNLLDSSEKILEIGFLVAKASVLGEQVLTLETKDTYNAIQIIVKGNVNGVDKDIKNSVTINDLAYYEFRGYIYGIPKSQYYTELNAVSYIKTGAKSLYCGIQNALNGVKTRSIGNVAEAAFLDTAAYDKIKYPYLVSEGVYSPYDEAQREQLKNYIDVLDPHASGGYSGIISSETTETCNSDSSLKLTQGAKQTPYPAYWIDLTKLSKDKALNLSSAVLEFDVKLLFGTLAAFNFDFMDMDIPNNQSKATSLWLENMVSPVVNPAAAYNSSGITVTKVEGKANWYHVKLEFAKSNINDGNFNMNSVGYLRLMCMPGKFGIQDVGTTLCYVDNLKLRF